MQVKFSNEKEVYLNIYSGDEERTQEIVISLENLDKKEIKTIKTSFGDEKSYLCGDIECSYEFLLKKDKK